MSNQVDTRNREVEGQTREFQKALSEGGGFGGAGAGGKLAKDRQERDQLQGMMAAMEVIRTGGDIRDPAALRRSLKQLEAYRRQPHLNAAERQQVSARIETTKAKLKGAELGQIVTMNAQPISQGVPPDTAEDFPHAGPAPVEGEPKIGPPEPMGHEQRLRGPRGRGGTGERGEDGILSGIGSAFTDPQGPRGRMMLEALKAIGGVAKDIATTTRGGQPVADEGEVAKIDEGAAPIFGIDPTKPPAPIVEPPDIVTPTERAGPMGQPVPETVEEQDIVGPDTPTPDLNPTDSMQSAIQKLRSFLDEPPPSFEVKPFSGAQRLAAGMLGALNPAAYDKFVAPEIARREKEALNRATLAQQQRTQKINATLALGQLESAQLDRITKQRALNAEIEGIASALMITTDSLAVTRGSGFDAISALVKGGFSEEAGALATQVEGIKQIVARQAALARVGVLPNIEAVRALQILDRKVNMSIARAFRRAGVKGSGTAANTQRRLNIIRGRIAFAFSLLYPQGRDAGITNKIGGVLAGSGVGSVLQNLNPKSKRELELLRSAFSAISGTINRMIGGGAALTPNEEARFAGVLLNVSDPFVTMVAKLDGLTGIVNDTDTGLTLGGGISKDPPAEYTDQDSYVLGDDLALSPEEL